MNRKNFILFVMLIFSLIIILLWYYDILNMQNIPDNTRYFYSASAQSFAALVAIILVIHTISASRIPNYQAVFGSTYRQILDKYHETHRIRKLLSHTGLVIAFFLILLIFVNENLFLMLSSLILATFILLTLLNELIDFFSTSLIRSGKNKFFDDCAYTIINKLNYDEVYKIFQRIKIFRTNANKEVHKDIQIDYEQISGLLRPIIISYGSDLLDKERMGENSYYDNFRAILDYVLKSKNVEVITNTVFYKIRPNFIKHIEFCIKDGHCIKYIPDVLNIILKIIGAFNKNLYLNMRDNYLKLLGDILKRIKDFGRDDFVDTCFRELTKVFMQNNLWDYKKFIELLDSLRIPNKQKIEYLELIVNTWERKSSFWGLDSDSNTEAKFKTEKFTINEIKKYIKIIKEEL